MGATSWLYSSQKIADSRSTRERHETLESLKTLVKADRYNRGLIMESQLARWQDLRDGGALGLLLNFSSSPLRRCYPRLRWKFLSTIYTLMLSKLSPPAGRCVETRDAAGYPHVVFDLTMRLPNFRPLDSDFACPRTSRKISWSYCAICLTGTGPHIDEAVRGLVMSVAMFG
ncbi:hypothetical protein BGW80DRAFT_878878 [Lactifluus volemus]|nr:hypothetical protein BGW80DRAFT_878878 [Lactifluus volemus]